MTGTPPKISLDAVYWKTSVSSTIVENPLLESFQTGVKGEEEKMWHGLIPRALRWRPRRSSPCAGPGGTAEEWHRCPQPRRLSRASPRRARRSGNEIRNRGDGEEGERWGSDGLAAFEPPVFPQIAFRSFPSSAASGAAF